MNKVDLPSWLAPVAELFDYLVEHYGALGIGVIMFLESAGIPFVSALVVLTAGNMIAGGKISFISAFFASLIGIVLGSMFSYFLGFLGIRAGQKLNQKWFSGRIKKTPYHKTKIYRFMERYGDFSVLVAQLWGATRTFISFPAGALEMNPLRFMAYTTLGGALVSVVLIFSSILLNWALRLLFYLLGLLLELPWWLWLLIVGIALFWYWAYFYYNRKTLQG